jgi:F-type H+-transporting ATPase subunit epsilon
MTLDILTPEKKLFSGEANFVHLPGVAGEFEILNHHAPIISALKEGIVKYRTDAGETQLNITGGFVECLHNKVIICAEGIVKQ